MPSSSATTTSINPLNRSFPARSWTQTGVHVPILNELDALTESDASKPTRMFSTSILRASRWARTTGAAA